MKLVIIDYGMGNTKSIQNAFNFLKQDSTVSNDFQVINDADAYILPGVGAFHEAMENIEKLNLKPILDENILNQKKPILGICLGMQILANSSLEIQFTKGLGYCDATVKGINNKTLRVPHVGWNSIEVKTKNTLFEKISSDTHFYFDHSFHFVSNEDIVSSTTLYGEEITASIQKDNIFATQFHPEKSQAAGLKLLRSFLNYVEKQC
jgi:glutamine amidotransferase